MNAFALQLADHAQVRWTFFGPGAEHRCRLTESVADFEVLHPVTRTAVAVQVRETACMRDAVAEWPPGRIIRRTRYFSARLDDDETGVDICISGVLPENQIGRASCRERV